MKYIIILLMVAFAGCVTERQPMNETFHLLHHDNDTAYKSITHDDYIVKENC